ncbi:hypothetical protein [Nocardia sp. NBC_01329]|uniref:hypothetical protein n=1 Tax=Nocardia sp. NBC_01329 TaxID=2903594 RepID=UPI002E146606|nr:hypothetical protein OG405_09665 [Nocardia sp. NBC_01329]
MSVEQADPAPEQNAPGGAPGHHRTGLDGFAGQELETELRVVAVGVEQGLRPIDLVFRA